MDSSRPREDFFSFPSFFSDGFSPFPRAGLSRDAAIPSAPRAGHGLLLMSRIFFKLEYARARARDGNRFRQSRHADKSPSPVCASPLPPYAGIAYELSLEVGARSSARARSATTAIEISAEYR